MREAATSAPESPDKLSVHQTHGDPPGAGCALTVTLVTTCNSGHSLTRVADNTLCHQRLEVRSHQRQDTVAIITRILSCPTLSIQDKYQLEINFARCWLFLAPTSSLCGKIIKTEILTYQNKRGPLGI